MRTTSRTRALTVACAMAATVAVLTSPANAAAAEPGRDAIGPGTGLQVYSNDEYVRIFGAERALAEGVPLPGQAQENNGRVSPQDPSIPWHRVNYSSLDWDYNDIPTRNGNNDFGARHAANSTTCAARRPSPLPTTAVPTGEAEIAGSTTESSPAEEASA